jgi:hypothetical protein
VGRQLGGVQHGQATRRPGTEVVHPAASLDRLDRGIDHPGQLGKHRSDGPGDPRVLLVDHPEDLDGAHRVDRQGPGLRCSVGAITGMTLLSY